MLRAYLTIGICLAGCFVRAQQHGDCCKDASDLIKILNHYHVQPPTLDAAFSKNLYAGFFKSLDPQSLLIASPDLVLDSVHSEKLVELIQSNDPSFLKSSSTFYQNKLKEYDQWVTSYLNKPLDFSQEDFFEIIPSSIEIPESTEALLKQRRKYIKHKVLEYLHKKEQVNPGSFNSPAAEAEARQSILRNEKSEIGKILGLKDGVENHVYSIFLKSIAKQFDPHTAYFSKVDAAEFESFVSEQGLSFGFDVVQNQQGDLVVERIVPAGPAWKSAAFNKGDVLVSVKTPDGVKTDLQFSDVAVAQQLLSSYSIQSAEFSLRKQDGQLKNVELKKEKIELSQNTIQGFVLSGKRKIGYISLPAFYTQWENESNPGCASDMAKELLKMKKEKIEGLIIDLRFNGGGALHEALNLAGIFIDVGALSVIQHTGELPVTLKDLNKGTIYDGPVVIMVNKFSASASEIFAATLQDYNRAIIVGTSTFGKATGQVVFPFTTNFDLTQANPGNGSVKVTTDKLYRVSGKSYQQRGVKPDIFLPDLTLGIPEGENFYSNSIPPDSIQKKTYYSVLPSLPIKILAEKSINRISNSQAFANIKELNTAVLSSVPLRQPDFTAHKYKIASLRTAYEVSVVEHSMFQALSLSFDSSLMNMDQDRSIEKSKVARELESSIYISEAFNILSDYISLNNK